MKKRLLIVLFSVLLLAGLGTYISRAEGGSQHQHKSFVWSMDDNEHWHICVGDGECPDGWIYDRGPHTFNGGDVCTTCGFDRRTGNFTTAWRVTDMNITMPAPAAGDYMYTYPIYDSSQATIVSYSYDPPIPGGMQGVFDYGTAYTITIEIESVPGRWFVKDAPTPCTLNGQPAAFIYVNGSRAKLQYTYPATAAAPQTESVDVYTIPAYVAVSGASENTPSPGAAVFHFKIWSGDSSVNINVVSNAVSTNGFGEFSNDLVFTVPKAQEQALKSKALYIQQYDGNANWQFDTRVVSFGWDSYSLMFGRWPHIDQASAPKVMVHHMWVSNIYDPVEQAPAAQPQQKPESLPSAPVTPENWTPAAPDTAGLKERPIEIGENETEVVFTLPIDIGVEQFRTDTPPEAVFHFGLYGMLKDQEYEWINDVVYTHGEGIYSGTVSFKIPADQLDQLIETGFDVRERSAAVPGWSFAGEVYHVDLFRVDGELQGDIRRLRNVTTAESGLKVLYFLNLYGKDGGEPYLMPANILGIEDLLREIHGKDRILLKDTFRIEKDGGKWEIIITAVKEGKEIGNADITMRYAKNGGEYEEYQCGDFLRVTENGKYARVRSIAKNYTLLRQKPFPGAETLKDDMWLGFNNDTIDYLDLPALDELFRRLRRDAGRVFDELPVECIENGYAFSGGAEEFDGFRMMALNMAQLYHEDWLALALNAALSEEMTAFAEEFESAFLDFNDLDMNNAGLMEFLKKLYPRTMESFSFNITQAGEYEYASEFSCEFAKGDDVWVIENEFTTEPVSEDDIDREKMGEPDEYGSGADFLRALILKQAPDKEKLQELIHGATSGSGRRRGGKHD